MKVTIFEGLPPEVQLHGLKPGQSAYVEDLPSKRWLHNFKDRSGNLALRVKMESDTAGWIWWPEE